MLLYNTLTRTKETFKPLKNKRVHMYVCGLTVYDNCHLGHGRTAVAFDVIVRYLRFRGYDVLFVRNITDIDDKIIKRAAENNESIDSLVSRYITLMHRDFDNLLTLRPDIEPRATGSIPAMIDMIQTLIDKGVAYVTSSGDVYYRVKTFKDYGKLSGQDIEALQTGVRIDPSENKEDTLDFALWKSSKPGEPVWDSPWGQGRPGWHIECSAMSRAHLGITFDIHGGGSDLIFPHHENEIAQSEACNGAPFAHYWMHTGMIRVDKEKMSKSLNNFFTIEYVLNLYPAEAVRYFLLSGHYRTTIEYSTENLTMAKAAMDRLYTALRGLSLKNEPLTPNYEMNFMHAMDDDFNTPKALAVLFELAHEINQRRAKNDDSAGSYGVMLKKLGAALGLLQQNPEQYLQGDVDHSDIDALIQARLQARKDKQWGESDRIRDVLSRLGVVLEDTKDGTTWRKL